MLLEIRELLASVGDIAKHPGQSIAQIFLGLLHVVTASRKRSRIHSIDPDRTIFMIYIRGCAAGKLNAYYDSLVINYHPIGKE